METLAIIQLVAGIVAELEGPGGELVRQLVGLAAKSAGDVPLTADELAYLNTARETAAARLGVSINAAEGVRP